MSSALSSSPWRRRLRVGAVAAVFGGLTAGLALWSTIWPAPLPAPAPYAGDWPPAAPPASMQVFQLPTGATHRSAAFAYRGGLLADKRDFAMTAVLVRHPRGDLLIDAGLGADVGRQPEEMPAWFRAITSYSLTRSAAAQLGAAGYDLAQLKGVLLTHAHWDHASGLSELASTPVLVTQAERDFVREGGWLAAVARRAGGDRFQTYGFEGGAYLGFASSHDVFGDGSVVVVPAPGHTPGSVMVFLTLPGGRHLALLGDLVWQREGITEREERPFLQRSLGDADPEAVRQNILKVAALSARFPGLVLAPAHDQRGFTELLPLPSRLQTPAVVP